MGGHSGGLGATIVTRGKGHSAVSKAAYIARCSLENERLGTRDDYSRKGAECLFSGVYAPKNAPEWTRDREQLWNHVEAFEKRKDSQLARELLIDLAHELTPEQNRYVLQDFIRENFTRKGLVADAAIHAPHQHSDERNIHAHVMVVLRPLDGTEFVAAKPRQTEAENVAELNGWKRAFEKRMNKELEKHGFEPRWDMRSNAERGLDREPEVHLGKAASALERDGIATAPGDINREIRERNRARQAEPANENDYGPAAIEAQRDELARLEAMAREFDSRDYGDEAPDFAPMPEPDDFGHGHDEGGDLSHEREGEAEARSRADDAALDAEMATMRREIAEDEAQLAELDAINEAVRDQFRQQREALNEAEFQTVLDAMREREARERGDDSASRAAHALDELAKTDPHGTARNFGYHRGDRLKSPEEMRREWADLMRGGVSADRAAENAAAWEKLAEDPAQDPAPAPTPETAPQLDQAKAQSRDHLADRAAWAERLRGFAAEPAQEARREPEADRTHERTLKPEAPTQAPEIERGGVFQKLRDFVRGWFGAAPQPEPPRDRRHDAAGERHGEHVRPAPAEPAQAQAQTQTQAPQPEAEPSRPAERFRRNIAEELVQEGLALQARVQAELAARRARETEAERAAREQHEREAEADHSRGHGDGSRERTRYHHGLLWELLHPFHDPRRRDHHPSRRPEP